MSDMNADLSGAAIPIADTDDHVLEIKDLSVTFRTRAYSGQKALNGLSLQVTRKQILGVVGVSGSGKSVLASAILGMLKSPPAEVSGSIKINGREIVGQSEDELRPRRGKDVSLILSNARFRLNPLLPVGEQIARAILAKRSIGKRAAHAQAVHLLEQVGIPDPSLRARALPHELSGGMCQRVVIAIGICNEPSLIIADEPTSGLDVTIQAQVLLLIKEILARRDSGMLMMTRDLGIVAHFCEHVVVLQEGHIVESAPVRDFFYRPQHEHSMMLLDAAFASRGADAQVLNSD